MRMTQRSDSTALKGTVVIEQGVGLLPGHARVGAKKGGESEPSIVALT